MRKKLALIFPVTIIVVLFGVLAYLASGHTLSVLEPVGHIGREERKLIYISSALMALICVPVYIMAFAIAWKYRHDNPKKQEYKPNWDSNRLIESLWWGFPLLIILILSVLAWQSSHSLDPYKALESDKKHLRVQVVALNWKWLFIYPEQNIASVGDLTLPEDRPIAFSITSDAPMNSFWIPQLGGQVYAMSGMETKLHLQADHAGKYRGSSANISGEGFASMAFNTHVLAQPNFDTWVESVRASSTKLTNEEYAKLAKPSVLKNTQVYSQVAPGLFDKIIMKYMTPPSKTEDGKESSHTNHIDHGSEHAH